MRLKFISTLLILLFVSHVNGVIASEQIDPSNLTQVNSFVSGIVSSDKEVSVMGGIAGQYSRGNNFLGLIEHKSGTKKGPDGKAPQDSRLRYFQVFNTGADIVPDVGFSVDYMKSWKMTKNKDTSAGSDIVALGAIAKVATPWDAFTIFPNIAYVQGQTEIGSNNEKVDLKGYQVNLFGSIALGDNGQYIVIQPQFMQLDAKPKSNKAAKGDISTFKVKTGYGLPISENGLWWTELSHTYTKTNGKVSLPDAAYKDDDHLVELSISYYF